MPNWTQNYVTFSGDSDTIGEIARAFHSDEPFQTLRPCPQDLRNPELTTWGGKGEEEREALRQEMVDLYGYESWYEWQVDNWGTKWDADDIDFRSDVRQLPDGKAMVELYFQTAWSPPISFYDWLLECNLDLFISGTYLQEEDGYGTEYSIGSDIAERRIIELGSEQVSNDECDTWDDPQESGCSTDPSFRAVTGTAAKLPLP